MGFLEALFGALEPVQHIASSSSSGLASSFGFVFQPPYQPGYKVTELPGNKLSLGPGRPYVLFLLAVLFPCAVCSPRLQNCCLHRQHWCAAAMQFNQGLQPGMSQYFRPYEQRKARHCL